ncbi:pyruvate dehydrogenase (acetyl-transferring) E1 component subunit alpha [Mariprofundus ferrooxydans]|uniref:Pyruvate dehydrogenase E1 component subunit alpha n=1 Tax=Mariprofundus ferrooxydans PV-1 TaxID=314345 RepID=Q0EVZ3_9PROT|nr:pyruvate dehydrogenase (acetyl-transferring) E1 component subunit alpha [Mariprofundus ferrooxydans]EAU53475.1 pyruvate dehydrogenase complex, E1 component, pyruvate dehydrogenase alpha subunit [Mariprofundus ferrooxydans PV-1]KON47124.1 dehydrogenase [Mariprofundus ferrooxydans]
MSAQQKQGKGIMREGIFYDEETLHQLHDSMLFIRRFEEKAGQMYGLKKIGGFCHLCNGQEAVCVGMQHAAEPTDYMMTSYRDHGHILARGSDPTAVMAELLGRAGGIVKGKGGSMHMFDVSKNFAGGNGIVGEQVPIGLGFGFSSWYRDDGRVTICIMGDGGINQGAVYESFNMAALWKLPIVFLVENNQYAMGTSLERASAETQLFKRGISFKIPGMKIDGMDVLEFEKKMREAIAHARSGEGPILVEAMTYRYRGHSMSDPATYRTRAEVDEWRTGRDPIARLQAQMIEAGLATEESFKEKDRDIKKEVVAVAKAAEAQPEPDASELWTDVYSDPIEGGYPYSGKVS